MKFKVGDIIYSRRDQYGLGNPFIILGGVGGTGSIYWVRNLKSDQISYPSADGVNDNAEIHPSSTTVWFKRRYNV